MNNQEPVTPASPADKSADKQKPIKKNSKSPGLIIVIVVLTALIVGGGVYFWQNLTKQNLLNKIDDLENQLSEAQETQNNLEEEISKLPVREEATGFRLINNRCSQEECLFDLSDVYREIHASMPLEVLGIATIKGYYMQIKRSAWGTEEDCDDFVITGGSEKLSQSFIDLIDGGNTVNSKNELNQSVINLYLDVLSEADQQKIKASTIDNQIEIVVLSPTRAGMGAPACYSFVEILKVR